MRPDNPGQPRPASTAGGAPGPPRGPVVCVRNATQTPGASGRSRPGAPQGRLPPGPPGLSVSPSQMRPAHLGQPGPTSTNFDPSDQTPGCARARAVHSKELAVTPRP